MSYKYPFSYQKLKKLPKISDGTRFYPACAANSNLFIARSQYYDTLIHQLPEGFISIYHTQFGERIFSASVLDSQLWYIITLLRFGDGIEMRPSYRSIFIAIQNTKLISQYLSDISKIIAQKNLSKNLELSQTDKWNTDIERVFPKFVIYPISSRTYFPQYVSWTHYNSSLFMFTIFDNNIHTFEVTYDKSFLTYKINPVNFKKGYSFRSVVSSNTPHIYLINSSSHKSDVPFNLPQCANSNKNNPNKQNNINFCKSPYFVDASRPDIPIKYGLPNEVKVYPTTEFHVFITSSRRKIASQSNENRCIVFANLDEISIVFPSSGYFLKIPHQYSIDEYIEITKKYNPKAKINLKKDKSEIDLKINEFVGFSQDEAYYRPASRMPLYVFKNNLILIAAPRRFITSVLIDQDDRIRASFVVAVFDTDDQTNEANKSSDISDNNNNNNANDDDDNNDMNSDSNNSKSEIDDERDKLFNMFSLNNKASQSLCETTGEIFKLKLNPSFFASKDPRFVIPILHYFIRPKHDVNFFSNSYIINNKIEKSVSQLVTEKAIQYFWNCEIFNEILLLQFNTSSLSSTFREKVCSTFIRPHFYKEWVSLFEPYNNMKDKSKNNSNKMMGIRPFIGSRTPDNQNYMKGRSSSMIIDIDNSNNNEMKISSSKKPPLSPTVLGSRRPTDGNYILSLSHQNGIDFLKDYSNSNSTFGSNDDDDVDDSSISTSMSSPTITTTPQANSLPKSKLLTNNDGNVPSQPIHELYQEDSTESSSKIRLSSIISTPAISHMNDEEMSHKSSNVLPIFNFRDIELKAPKLALESLQMSDFQAFYKSILNIYNESIFFDLFQYSEKIRFPLYMQFIAIKMSLSEKPLYKTVFINDKLIKNNQFTSATVKEFWSAFRMVPTEINWPQPEFKLNAKPQQNKKGKVKLSNSVNKKLFEEVKRQWWFLRSQKNTMVQIEVSQPEENLFNFVEQVTNKCELGTETFQLHQNMFGFGMYQTVESPTPQ